MPVFKYRSIEDMPSLADEHVAADAAMVTPRPGVNMLAVMQLVVALVHVAVYFAGASFGWWGDGPNARDTVFLSALVVALVVVLLWLRRRSPARRADAARRAPLTLLIPMPVFTALTAESSIELIRTAGGAGDRHPFLSAVILIASLAGFWSLGRQDAASTGEPLADRE